MGYYTTNGGLIGVGQIPLRKGVFNLEAAQYYPSGTEPVEFDLTTGSLPSGMYVQSSVTPSFYWTGTGARFAGNAGSSSYPLRIGYSFAGDYLFQLSTRIDQDPGSSNWCSDASIGLFNTTYTSGWGWTWGAASGRIAAQNNCDTPYLYGYSNSTNITSPNSGDVLKSPYVSSGGWITMHLYHEPTLSRTRYEVTAGSKDWDASGTRLGSSPNSGILQISDHFDTTYFVGISADDDQDSMYANGFRYIPLQL